jgi:hypothetical protein
VILQRGTLDWIPAQDEVNLYLFLEAAPEEGMFNSSVPAETAGNPFRCQCSTAQHHWQGLPMTKSDMANSTIRGG